jgi:hypothetical protein
MIGSLTYETELLFGAGSLAVARLSTAEAHNISITERGQRNQTGFRFLW